MPANPQYRPWGEPHLAQLHRLFLEGDGLIELADKLSRTSEDILRTLSRLHLLTIREGYYYRTHPTPFAETHRHRTKSKALSTSLEAPSPPPTEPSPQRELTVADLELPIRCFNVLRSSGIHTVSQLCEHTEASLSMIPNMGRRSIREIVEALEDRGFKLAPCSKPIL